jgi:hypothetical protein
MSARGLTLKAAVAVVVLSSAVGVAVGATGGAPPAPEPAAPEQRTAAVIGAVDAQQLQTLSVLGRTATRTDAVPAAARALIEHGSGEAVGANPDLARRALTTALGEALYVVPARGWVCLTSSGGHGLCATTAQIAEGYAVGLEGTPSGYRLSGLVPNGVGRVEVRADGQTASVAPSGNAWQADVTFAPKTVAWTGPAGERVVEVSPPPPAPTGPVAPEGVLPPSAVVDG